MRSVSPGRSFAGFAISVVALSAAAVSMTLARPENAQEPVPGADHAAVDAVFAPWSSPDSPGCSLGIVRDGELIYERGYGSANLDW